MVHLFGQIHTDIKYIQLRTKLVKWNFWNQWLIKFLFYSNILTCLHRTTELFYIAVLDFYVATSFKFIVYYK